MPKIHPHAEATYRVISLENGAFGVEVSIPDRNPTTVSVFKTEADAEAWIAEHRPGWSPKHSLAVNFADPVGSAVSAPRIILF